jgi:hypothetical protein
MLLEIPYKNGDVVSLKLASGEEVLGRLEEEKGDTLVLSKPRMITAMQEGIGLAPFMFSVSIDSKCAFKTASILCITKTEEGFAKQYLEGTTGIQV